VRLSAFYRPDLPGSIDDVSWDAKPGLAGILAQPAPRGRAATILCGANLTDEQAVRWLGG
jgi:hypothetical protein